ncbi:MAG: NAD(P)H-hydrate dehydratase, partial [Candidatus Omnitrophica bacterium]|nr:NAD(P)H-hydrate dehydratase [Candidatus Omnitrophota bacterium]
CLCAQSALRIGAGLVRIAVPGSVSEICAVKLTEVMSLALPEKHKGYLCPDAFSVIEEFLPRIDVIALGCGASTNEEAGVLMLKIIREIDKPMVIDADGLNAIASDKRVLEERKTKTLILTPHLVEFSRLLKLESAKIDKERKALVKDFALRYNLTLVLKGYHTLVSDGKKIFENKTGNPGMATAGTGDVLCGMIAGLLAQGLNTFEAARCGVYLHGLAGDFAAREKTQNCLIASDIIEYLPKALKAQMTEDR